jgi:hypothetical protein
VADPSAIIQELHDTPLQKQYALHDALTVSIIHLPTQMMPTAPIMMKKQTVM